MTFLENRKLQIIVALLVITAISFFLSMNSTNIFVILFVLLMMSLSIIAIVFGFIFFTIDAVVIDETKKMDCKRGMNSAMFIMCCIVLLIVYYYYASQLPESIGFIRDGVTAGVSAIIGGLALESILRLKR